MTQSASEPWEHGPPHGFADDDQVPRHVSPHAANDKPIGPCFTLWEPSAIWAPLPPPDYLVTPLIVRGSLSLFVAYGASLKTWIALALCLATSTGSEWLDMPCQQVESCFIDFESGDYELRRRAQKIARGHAYDMPIVGFTFASMPGMSLADGDFYTALAPLTQRFGLIAIDSLSAGSGGVDENDARFAGPLNRLKALASVSKCCIILIHHSRKSAGDAKNYDDREMVRGSSAIFNAADVVLNLIRAEEGLFTVRQSKARGGKCVAPFTVRVDDVAEDAVTVTAGKLAEEGPKKSPSKSLSAAKATIITLLAASHDLRSKNDVFRRTKGKRGTIFDALDELVEHGLVVTHEGAFRLASEVT